MPEGLLSVKEGKLTKEEIALIVEIAKLETATPLFELLLKKNRRRTFDLLLEKDRKLKCPKDPHS